MVGVILAHNLPLFEMPEITGEPAPPRGKDSPRGLGWQDHVKCDRKPSCLEMNVCGIAILKESPVCCSDDVYLEEVLKKRTSEIQTQANPEIDLT